MHRSNLIAALERQLKGLPSGSALGVAVSGGPDSFALAVLSVQVARTLGINVYLFHVHHGLQAIADQWTNTVVQLGRRLGAPSVVRRVRGNENSGDGIEAAARHARYAALADMATEVGATHILLGHHQDDQVETVMLRLLRGAGLDGMAAMDERSQRDGLTFLRPWLRVSRNHLVAVARHEASVLGLPVADDPTNVDPRYARGVLRTEVFPAIARHWPGYRSTLERFARLAGEASQILHEVSRDDLERLRRPHPAYGTTLARHEWITLSPARRSLVLRAWLAQQGCPAPSEARLANICRQLVEAGPDRQVLVQHGAGNIRVYRDRILFEPTQRANEQAPSAARAVCRQDAAHPSIVRRWQGEAEWQLPELGGTLYFDDEPVDTGIDPAWLKAQPVQIGFRRGGERLRLRVDGPARTLKNLYQEVGIPAWERPHLPLVWRAGHLIFAAGLGLDSSVPRSHCGVRLRWQPHNP